MEMYMMAEKARLFGDHATLRQVLAARGDPKQVKALGRQVRGFDMEMWDAHCMEAVVKGNLAKFTQNSLMLEKLIATRNMVLAEASPLDTRWGIGLRADDPDCKVPSRWRGSNRLGCALMVVREQLGGGPVPRHLLPASMLPLLDVKLPAGLADSKRRAKSPNGEHGQQAMQDASKDTFDPSLVVEVGNYVLFWEPPAVFCQWTPSDFVVDGVRYDCMEMYMMAEKARLFGDHATLRQVLAAMLPLLDVKLPVGPTLPGPTGQSSPQAGAAPSNRAAVEPTPMYDEGSGLLVQSEETETSPLLDLQD
eukprot:CAMPEP_0202853614 /NCGR_PEP_ID=MMETSP1389-20130828/90570_1 /ASSEMBLY_ACC=CAM_ASM_000865 /TAXON_ID=302021 /ORGANISM="Rhodomonas sp., Strain CCMP768" /LENGTH=306 /DNA_ID=CAMNT_0049532165 /DNA_START=1 /DNA_END=921 /DNA_ORIENTATION=+